MGNGKKGGRPQKTVKKVWRISIRLTDVDRYLLKRKAEAAGTNLADFIRDAALKGKIIARQRVQDYPAFRELIGISSNLNQVARAVNKQGILPLYSRLSAIILFIDELMKRYKDDKQNHSS